MTPLSPDGAMGAVLRQLRAPQPVKRRTAAHALRNLKIPATGPALLEALREELQNPQSWDTQYQMIMALGECRHYEALPLLRELIPAKRGQLMISIALGDSIVRLSSVDRHDVAPILEFLSGLDRNLIEGAFRAMALLRMVPGPEDLAKILHFARKLPPDDPMRVWVAAAAAGWGGPELRPFLEQCLQSAREDVRRAAAASMEKKYLKWKPL
jgi:HEAT repeat protein